MPPKVKINKSDIVKAALNIVREKGENALNARAVAAALECSTQPIFSNYANMEALREDVIAEAYNIYYNEYLQPDLKTVKAPPLKVSSMAYIRFAKNEKELFKLLFMRDRSNDDEKVTDEWEEIIKLIQAKNKVSYEQATKIYLETWLYIHGVATMLATSYLTLDFEL